MTWYPCLRGRYRAAILAALLAGPLCCAPKQVPPKVMLWSWYAADDFRSIADPGVGVAYLALTINLEGQRKASPDPRTIPVRIPPTMYRMAVVRIQYRSNDRPAFSPQQREFAVNMILEIVSLDRPQALQIDFDAPQSAWPFYRQLLADVHTRVSPDTFLSMTALVSWCGAGSWMTGLPVDEIVPMAFSMGQITPAIVTMLQGGGQFGFAACRQSVGLRMSADSPIRPHKGQRAYFFPSFYDWQPHTVAAAKGAFIP